MTNIESIDAIYRCYEKASPRRSSEESEVLEVDSPEIDEVFTGCQDCGDGRLNIRSEETLKTDDKRCANCTSTANTREVGRCPVCERDGVPLQDNHILGRDVSTETQRVCKACHLMLDSWRYAWRYSPPTDPRAQHEKNVILARETFKRAYKNAVGYKRDLQKRLYASIFPRYLCTITFDFETTITAAKSVRFGFASAHGLAEGRALKLFEQGLFTLDLLDRPAPEASKNFGTLGNTLCFFHSTICSKADHAILKVFCESRKIKLLGLSEFIVWLYDFTNRWKATWIGYNIAFDITRFAREVVEARGFYAGGMSMRLCDCVIKDAIFGVAGNPHVAATAVAVPEDEKIKLGGRKRCKTHGYFSTKALGGVKAKMTISGRYFRTTILDMMQVVGALSGENKMSLARACAFLQVPEDKAKREISLEELGGLLTVKSVEYGLQDVVATFEVYVRGAALYRKHKLQRQLHDLYSASSIGKDYLNVMGITPMTEHRSGNRVIPGRFDNVDRYVARGYSKAEAESKVNQYHRFLGISAEAYIGGRTECGWVKKSLENICSDWKSQYPTIFTKMNLQEILLAEYLDCRSVTTEVPGFISRLTVEALLDKSIWTQLRGFALVAPNDDFLPERWKGKRGAINIAFVRVMESKDPVWLSFPEIAASFLETGWCPRILEAWAIEPHGRIRTTPHAIYGDPDYTIDFERGDDFFQCVVERLTDFKVMAEKARDRGDLEEAHRYGLLAGGLKTLSTSASYGIFFEVNPDEESKIRSEEALKKKRPRREYYCGHRLYKAFTRREENTGKFFCSPIATLVTSGAHLLQAMLDREASDRGLIPAYMDTDSYFFGRDEDLHTREEFIEQVSEIQKKMQRLSPYREGIELLKIEEGVKDRVDLELISSKRYCVYNVRPDGSVELRKATGHGLGGNVPPKDYKPLVPIDEETLRSLKCPTWVCDLWHAIIQKKIHGNFDLWRRLSAKLIKCPARTRITINTWNLFEFYSKRIPGLKPFDFVYFRKLRANMNVDHPHYFENGKALTHLRLIEDDTASDVYKDYPHEVPIQSEDVVIGGDLCRVKFLTLWDKVRDYENYDDVKSVDPRCIGRTEHKQVSIEGRVYSGKETIGIDPETEGEDEILGLHGYYSNDVKVQGKALEAIEEPEREKIKGWEYVSYKRRD